MITKGSDEYKRAGQIANELMALAATNRWNDNSVFGMNYDKMGRAILQVAQIDSFAGQVAQTVEKSMNPFGKQVAFCSSKQAWIIACAIVENNISFEL